MFGAVRGTEADGARVGTLWRIVAAAADVGAAKARSLERGHGEMVAKRGRAGLQVVSGAGKRLDGFKKFIVRGNVVDLAVGIVIGAAFTGVVQALVKDLITPFIGVFGGIPDFSTWAVAVNGSRFLIGDFINTILSFLIVSLVV